MTTELQGVKINPVPEEEDLRRMARGVNNLVEFANRGYSEYKSKVITASSAATDEATIIYAGSTSANINFTLQSAVGVKDRYYGVMKTDGSTFAVSIQAASTSETINGSTSSSTTTQYSMTWVHSDGSNWFKW